MIVIGKYKLIKDDEKNLSLFVKRMKTKKDGTNVEDDYHIGYYGYVDQALSKIINLEALNGIGDEEAIMTAVDLKDSISTLYDSLKESCHISAKDL